MASKKFFTADKKQGPLKSNLNQVIDVIQEDISGSATRRKYQTFVTGGIGPGVTSSLYQTVYDQDFTLQTANAVMDMTIGLFHDDKNSTARKNLVTLETGYQKTSNGQLIFDAKSTMMMREKVNIYRQYAKLLLGDANLPFAIDTAGKRCTVDTASGYPGNIATSTKIMDACVFVNVKRLFARDKIRPETLALGVYENAAAWYSANPTNHVSDIWQFNYDSATGTATAEPSEYASTSTSANAQANLFGTGISSSEQGVKIIADIGANSNLQIQQSSGEWAFLRHASNINEHVGIIFYEAGIAVLNLGGSTQAATGWGANPAWVSGAAAATGTATQTTDAARYKTATSGKGDGGEGQDSTIKHFISPRDRINGILDGMISTHDSTHVSEITSRWGNVAAATTGQTYMGFAKEYEGDSSVSLSQANKGGAQLNPTARVYPDLLVSASIDDIVDHIGFTRFSSGSLTATAFQNITNVQSTIYFCRATASQFNASNNSTWADTTDTTKWLLSDSSNNSPYSYITTVLLYDDDDDIIAIAKLNRPIEKNNQSELTIRVRLDF